MKNKLIEIIEKYFNLFAIGLDSNRFFPEYEQIKKELYEGKYEKTNKN